MTFSEAALPIRHPGKTNLGILLIHGFTSTPGSQAGWAEGLHRATGATVTVPLLPGHGTRWQDLNRVSWKEWESTVVGAYDDLAATHQRVVVGGLSLGGALAILVALRRPQTAALLLVNHLMWLDNPLLPLAPILQFFLPSTPAIAGDLKNPEVVEPAYDQVPTGGVAQFLGLLNHLRPRLGSITMPTLLFKSREDHVIPIRSTLKTIERLSSTRKDLVWLENSYHVATMDHDLPIIIDRSASFLKEVLPT